MKASIPLIAAILLSAPLSHAQESSLKNPTKREYKNELVRLLTPAPGPAGSFIVKSDGKEISYQVEEIGGKSWIWALGDFAPGASQKYSVSPGKPAAAKPAVSLRKEGNAYILDNGEVSVKLPAAAGDGIPGPVTSIKLGDEWVGASTWQTEFPLKSFTATVIGDGTVLAKVRLRYEFDGKAGIDGDIPAFSEIDVSLAPGWQHAAIDERHEMARGDFWEFEASKGWSPKDGVSRPFSSGGPGSGNAGVQREKDRPLKPGAMPYQQPDLYINLLPRWSQSYKDGWYFAATDGSQSVGAIAVRASQWMWPHDNSIGVLVRESGDYASFRAPTWHGSRLWWIFSPDLAPETDYVAAHAWEHLDKLNHDFILDWAGHEGTFRGMNFYDGGQMNPTGGLRRAGRGALEEAGKEGSYSDLTRVQAMFHPDAFGDYWLHWSPQNANFFTDFNKLPIALAAGLKSHPQFEQFRKAAEEKARQDMHHMATLPGGAGQECPGYQHYALEEWAKIAEATRKHLGFDPTTWERYKAAEYFRKRITQPDGDKRRILPMGDTHPAKPKDGHAGGPGFVEVPAAEVAKFKTEELPGFGVIFNNEPGTPQETYLSFKSGPNRGHYHGDQLSIHYAAFAKALAVDHYASYHPRPGQEHMHNRVAFHTDEFPYANMDGYERLIAFQSGETVDIAIGQVESDRLRAVKDLPPEIWDQRYPRHDFKSPLTYRRTVVFMKGQPDYIVLRDQWWAPEPLSATFCLHVHADKSEQRGSAVDFGNLTLFTAHPEKPVYASFPWSHENGGGEKTEGARLTMKGNHGEFISVLYPGKPAAMSAIPGGVKVGNDEIVFAGDQPTSGDAIKHVTVKRGGAEVASLAGDAIDMNRSQGDIGLFVPDAGYPFGEIPDWLIKQRAGKPDWAK